MWKLDLIIGNEQFKQDDHDNAVPLDARHQLGDGQTGQRPQSVTNTARISAQQRYWQPGLHWNGA